MPGSPASPSPRRRASRAGGALALSVLLGVLLAVGGPAAASAQGSAELVAQGDRESAARRPAAALALYEKALAADSLLYPALWRAAREAVDLGEFETDEPRRTALYARAETLARRAVALRPGEAEGHFHLARALGRAAMALGPRDRVRYSADVRTHALAALAIAPRHPGALHVMGVWHAEVMRLNGITRAVARAFLGGAVLSTASWAEATRYMEAAVAVEPERIVHRLDLARVYRDSGRLEQAKAAYADALRLPLHDPNDDRYRRSAEEELRRLR